MPHLLLKKENKFTVTPALLFLTGEGEKIIEYWFYGIKILYAWSPTGKARGTSMKYPPTPMDAETLR